jgi:hypothetical protein
MASGKMESRKHEIYNVKIIWLANLFSILIEGKKNVYKNNLVDCYILDIQKKLFVKS